MNSLTFTPDGFRDIYSSECNIRDFCLFNITNKLSKFGYLTIDTPVLEYEDLFREAGTVKSEKLFRFFDKDGKVLSLRPDFTPSIARAASLLLNDDPAPLRIKYFGKVFRNDSMLKGYLREYVQMGAECIGDNSIYYDAEIINIVYECFLAVGINDFNICISSSKLIDLILNISNLTESERKTAGELISNKNFFGLADLLKKSGVSSEVSSLFRILENDITDSSGLSDLFEKTSRWPEVQNEIRYLMDLYSIIVSFDIEDHISFDLSLDNYMDYYTGVIFSGYTYGTDSAVVKGGRYDNLLESFDSEKGAIGFAFSLDKLVQAISRQNIDIEVNYKMIYLLTDSKSMDKCIKKASELRSEDKETIVITIPENKDEAATLIKNISEKKYGSTYMIFREGES